MIGLIEAQGGHAENMEPSRTNPGIPDINYCVAGVEGNVECKYAIEDGLAPKIRPTQLVWFRERVRAGGYPMLAYYVDGSKAGYMDNVYIFQGRFIDRMAKCRTVSELYSVPHLHVLDPEEMIQGLFSEMASWHDEVEG